jgi:hypothetical protein
MMRVRVARRPGAAPVVAIALVVATASASAPAAEGDTCVTAYEGAQQRIRDGQLVLARAELDLCMGSCPAALARDCAGWKDDVGSRIGRVAVEVRRDGAPVDPARVMLDGAEARPGAGGVIDVDPGAHTIVVELPGAAPAEQRITVPPGGVARARFDLESAAAGGLPPASIALGLAGGGALALGAVLGVVGHLQVADLRDTCAPDCDVADVDSVRTVWIAGGVAAGVGIGALAVAFAIAVGGEDHATEVARALGPAPPSGPAGGSVRLVF